jgi:hypothetical protein
LPVGSDEVLGNEMVASANIPTSSSRVTDKTQKNRYHYLKEDHRVILYSSVAFSWFCTCDLSGLLEILHLRPVATLATVTVTENDIALVTPQTANFEKCSSVTLNDSSNCVIVSEIIVINIKAASS